MDGWIDTRLFFWFFGFSRTFSFFSSRLRSLFVLSAFLVRSLSLFVSPSLPSLVPSSLTRLRKPQLFILSFRSSSLYPSPLHIPLHLSLFRSLTSTHTTLGYILSFSLLRRSMERKERDRRVGLVVLSSFFRFLFELEKRSDVI